MPDINDYLQEITTTTRKPLVKVEFLRREDETPQIEIVTDIRLQGNLNIKNRNGTRRTMNMTLDNTAQSYFPSLDSPIWIGSKVKISMGLEIDGDEFFIDQGVFVMSNPNVNGDSVTINGEDKFALLDGSLGGETDSDIIIPNGTTIGNAVRSIMTLSTDPQDPVIESGIENETLPYTIIHETGSTLGAILEEIAFAYSLNIFYNEQGALVLESDTSDSDKGSVWDFNADLNSETNYQQGSSQYKFNDVFNSILVIGDNVNGAVVRAKVQNNDLTSDTSIPNIGYERTLVVKDNIISTTNLCEQRGIYELKRATNVLTQSRVNSISLYHLDVDKVVTITDSRLNFDTKRVLLDSISLPFSNSSMSLTVVETFDIDE